jgi:hypothetical protein
MQDLMLSGWSANQEQSFKTFLSAVSQVESSEWMTLN